MQAPHLTRFLLALSLTVTADLPGLAHAQAVAQASPPAAAVPAFPEAMQDFDSYVNNVLQAFDVPGISVAIVKDGKVLLEKGYGLRRLPANGRAGQPATAHSLFAIASNTKAFTAAALAMLADEGKLELDDRVVDHLAWFHMADPWVTREMRIRDLLSHRSGLSLGAGDLLYWPTSDYSTREVVERLAHVPLQHGFRARYAYDNILFAVAELVVEQASGMDFQDFLQQRIFQPLGMTETRFNYHHIKPTDLDVATGYAAAEGGGLEPMAPLSWANNSGAGGIYSSVHDMAKWLMVQLAGGVYRSDEHGKPSRLFSSDRQQAMWSVVTPIPPRAPRVPELAAIQPNFAGYGLGWHLSGYRGHKLVWHTGGWPGFVSRVTLVPELKLGMVVLTNQQSGAAFQAITYRILDAWLGAPRTDWIAAWQASERARDARADQSWQKHLAARAADSKPSLPLAAYAGRYQDPWYGAVDLRLEQGRLVMQFAHTAQLLGDLEHWQHDSFIVRWRDRSLDADAFVSFHLDADGKIVEMRMQPVSPRTDFSFDFQDLRLVPLAEEAD